VILALAVSGGGLVVGASAASASSRPRRHDQGIDQEVAEKFESCLKKHGVKTSLPGAADLQQAVLYRTFPSGGGAPAASRRRKIPKGVEACSKLLPGSQLETGGNPSNGSSTAFAAFRNCMTLNHVTLPRGVRHHVVVIHCHPTSSSTTDATRSARRCYLSRQPRAASSVAPSNCASSAINYMEILT